MWDLLVTNEDIEAFIEALECLKSHCSDENKRIEIQRRIDWLKGAK